MKIVIINHEFRAHFPARIKYFYEYAKEQGHQVKVIELYGISICYQFSDTNASKDWEILFPNAKTGTVSFNALEMRINQRLDEINPDVIMSGIATFPVGIISLRWAKAHDKGIVEFGNALKYTYPHSWFVHTIKRMMFRNVDAFFCPSPAWNDDMMFWGFKEKEIFHGLNVANNHDWEGEVQNVSFPELPKEYVLTCGRQVYMKNLPRLVKCYLQYKKEGGKLPMVMVGEGVKHQEIVELANGDKDIIFMPFQTHDKMREIFVQMKCLMLPSFREETWGIVVSEAMAAKNICAVSTEAGCCKTLIQDGYNGFSYNPYDEKAIVNVLHKIESLDDVRLKDMQSNANATIQDWGAERFGTGALEACIYAYNNKKKVTKILDRLLIKYWRGRVTISNK